MFTSVRLCCTNADHMKARLVTLTSDGPLEFGWVLTLELDNTRFAIQIREGCDMRELL